MKIKQIEILTEDLLETEKFYTEVLELKIDEKFDSLLSFNIGESKLIFKKGSVQKPIYHFAFNIPSNQIQEAKTWISSKVALIAYNAKTIIDFEGWNAKSLYFLDNNGNILEFIARDLNESTESDFSSLNILSISEIGLVSNNVEKLSNKLVSSYRLPYFTKQIQSKDFSVLGDDSGLIICVSTERNWFPTQISAEKFWVKVSIENSNRFVDFEHGSLD
jgi:catechol 2,3-dioxygenase-like lactoylglutathione lyase family enzyme